MAQQGADRAAARLKIVEEHVARENAGDLDGIVATFGEAPSYEDESWGERYDGAAAVRGFYEALITALPDLDITVNRRHLAEDTIILEVTVSGTHLGPWRGLPATGRRVAFPLCAIYSFTDDDRLAGERIYYDRATLLRQLGVWREPTTPLGRIGMALMHPHAVVRAYGRRLARLARRRR